MQPAQDEPPAGPAAGAVPHAYLHLEPPMNAYLTELLQTTFSTHGVELSDTASNFMLQAF